LALPLQKNNLDSLADQKVSGATRAGIPLDRLIDVVKGCSDGGLSARKSIYHHAEEMKMS
jgi:hypothetical protein